MKRIFIICFCFLVVIVYAEAPVLFTYSVDAELNQLSIDSFGAITVENGITDKDVITNARDTEQYRKVVKSFFTLKGYAFDDNGNTTVSVSLVEKKLASDTYSDISIVCSNINVGDLWACRFITNDRNMTRCINKALEYYGESAHAKGVYSENQVFTSTDKQPVINTTFDRLK